MVIKKKKASEDMMTQWWKCLTRSCEDWWQCVLRTVRETKGF